MHNLYFFTYAFAMLKRHCIVVCMLLFFQMNCFAQTAETYYEEGQKYELALNEKVAYNHYLLAHKSDPSSIKALYKCAELSSRIGTRETNSHLKLTYYESSLAYAKLLIKINPAGEEANLAMSMALGRLALTKSGKEKIRFVKEIKMYADKTIAINSKNFKAWHIIGKWNYEVSDLNFLEISAIKLFFGGIPEASFSTAIQAYEKVKGINPYFCSNYLELAKAYKKTNQTSKAVANLKLMLSLQNNTEEDASLKKQAAALIKAWN